MNNISFKGYYGRILRRIVAIVILLFLTIQLIFTIRPAIEEYFDEKDKTTALHSCEAAYYNGNYMDILDYIYLYKAYGTEFDMYFEVGKAYENLTLYKQWQTAANTIEASKNDFQDKANFYSLQVKEQYQNTKFKENIPILKNFYNKIVEFK